MKFTQKTSIVGLINQNSIKLCTRDIRNDQYPLLSNAFFCANCGNIWARIHRSIEGRNLDWEIIHTQCFPCSKENRIPVRLNVPGSIWNYFLDSRQLEYIPIEILRMELDLLLNLEEIKYV